MFVLGHFSFQNLLITYYSARIACKRKSDKAQNEAIIRDDWTQIGWTTTDNDDGVNAKKYDFKRKVEGRGNEKGRFSQNFTFHFSFSFPFLFDLTTMKKREQFPMSDDQKKKNGKHFVDEETGNAGDRDSNEVFLTNA